MDNPKQQLCVMSIVLQDITDDDAIGFKKKLDAVLQEYQNHRVEFRLMESNDGSTQRELVRKG